MLMPSKIKYLLCLIPMSRSSPLRATSPKFRMNTTHSSISIWLAKTNMRALLSTLVSSKQSWKHTKHCKIISTINILVMLKFSSKHFTMHVPMECVKTLSTTFWTSYPGTWKKTTVTYYSICTKEHSISKLPSTRDGEIKWLEFPHMQWTWHWLH